MATQVVVSSGKVSDGFLSPGNIINTTSPVFARNLIQGVSLSKFFFETQPPGSGESTTAKLLKNGVATAISLDVNNDASVSENGADSVSFSSSDVMSWTIEKSSGSVSTTGTVRYQASFA